MLRCLDFTFREEGGFVDNPSDPGGATNLGITLDKLRDWRGDPDLGLAAIKALGRDEASAIYAADYWNPVRGDDLPVGLDLLVFDFAVTSQVVNSSRLLQTQLGVRSDGWIGDVTLEAAHGAAGYNEHALLLDLAAKLGVFYVHLKAYPTFGRGWMARLKRRQDAAFRLVGLPVPL